MLINVASKIDKSCLNKIYLPQTFMNFASIIYRYCQRATCYSNSCILCLGVVSISYLGALMVAPVDPIKVKYIGRDHLSEMNTESFLGKTFWQADYPRWIHSSAVWKTINTDEVDCSVVHIWKRNSQKKGVTSSEGKVPPCISTSHRTVKQGTSFCDFFNNLGWEGNIKPIKTLFCATSPDYCSPFFANSTPVEKKCQTKI